MKRKTTTEVVTKALARSGPELRPEQIRLADEAQSDKNKVYTQSDLNQNAGGGGGGGIPDPIDLDGYAKTDYVDSADQALNILIAANAQAIEDIEIPEGGGAAGGINEVLAEGNFVDPGQSLHFKVKEGNLPPFKRDIIDVEGGSGLRLGGLVSTYIINEPFTLDTDNGPTQEFGFCNRRISAVDDYYYGEHPKGGTVSASIGLNGLTWHTDSAAINIRDSYVKILCGDWDNPSLNITANENKSTITATEFIGDGSKLTNLPGGAAAPVLPGQKWNLVTAHALPPAPGEMMWVEGDKCLYCHATTADGIVLGNASTSFDQYDVNGTMVVSMYKHGVGIEAVFKAGLVEMITQGGQTFWKILKMNSARFNLNEGTAYNVTASGLF